MKPLWSRYWMGVVLLVACVAAVFAILAPQDFALRGFAWVTAAGAIVALSVGFVAGRSTRSMGQVLDDVDHEPALAPTRSPGAGATERNRKS